MNEKIEHSNAELLARIDRLAADNAGLRKEISTIKEIVTQILANQIHGTRYVPFGHNPLDYRARP